MFNRTLANLHFWLWQFGIFGKVMLMYALGYAYFPRWVVDYLPLPEWTTAQMWLSVAAGAIGLGFLIFAVNLAISARRGTVATEDPWALSGLENSHAAATAAPAE
jgi:cytochrome c oxidase subunit I